MPAMGTAGNCGSGKAWDCSGKEGIVQGRSGDCFGALRMPMQCLREWVRWVDVAVVHGFCSTAAKENEGRRGRRGAEAVAREAVRAGSTSGKQEE